MENIDSYDLNDNSSSISISDAILTTASVGLLGWMAWELRKDWKWRREQQAKHDALQLAKSFFKEKLDTPSPDMLRELKKSGKAEFKEFMTIYEQKYGGVSNSKPSQADEADIDANSRAIEDLAKEHDEMEAMMLKLGVATDKRIQQLEKRIESLQSADV